MDDVNKPSRFLTMESVPPGSLGKKGWTWHACVRLCFQAGDRSPTMLSGQEDNESLSLQDPALTIFLASASYIEPVAQSLLEDPKYWLYRCKDFWSSSYFRWEPS